MTTTDINTLVTIISIVLTLISWVITIWKWVQAYNSRKQLESVESENMRLLKLMESFEILPDISRFHEIYLKCAQRTKVIGWNKGSKGKDIVNDVDAILRDINKHLPKISVQRKSILESSSNFALTYISQFVIGTPETSMEMVNRLDRIDKILQEEAEFIRIQRVNFNH